MEDHWAPAAVAAAPTAIDVAGLHPPIPSDEGLPADRGPDPPASAAGAWGDFDGFGTADAPIDPTVPAGSGHDAPDLPFFDPSASAAPAIAEVFAGRHPWRVGTRAGLLAMATAIPTTHGREAAARAFEDALTEDRWPGFFRSWLHLAPSLDCPRVIALAIALKEHWDDSPNLWRFRDAPGRASRQHDSARGHFSWRRAVAMAQASAHEPVWRILDEDLVADWEDLSEPCPGFWSLAEWLEVMSRADEAEVHSLGLVAARGRAGRALHFQDLCERLGMGRRSATGGFDHAPMVDPDVSTFPFRDGHFRPGGCAAPAERRAPTEEEKRVREVE